MYVCMVLTALQNGADTAHLGFLHMPLIFERAGNLLHLHHSWDCTWEPGTGDEWFLTHIELAQYVTWFGRRLGFTGLPVKIRQIGPGLVYLRFTLPIGEVMVIECVSPREPLLQKAGHAVWASRFVPRVVAKFILWVRAAFGVERAWLNGFSILHSSTVLVPSVLYRVFFDTL